jgi:tetratricopeptide (TPR) repeat protein
MMPQIRSEITDSHATNSVATTDGKDRELEESRRGVVPLSADYPDWLHTSRGLASLLSERFQETSQDIFLIECIDIQRHICAVCTPGSPDRALSVSDLASSLGTLFQERGEESLLSEAIDLNREALSLRRSGDPDRSVSCNNLAYTLWMRFNQTGEKSLLTEAIDLHRESLALRHSGHPDRSLSCNNLAISLKTCFDQTGDEAPLMEAIDLHREAFSLRTSGHPDRYKSCNNLAISLSERFRQTGANSLLAEAIDLFREALSLCPTEHPNRSHAYNNLALSLEMRFDQTGEESLLAEAIEFYREALSLRPDGNPFRCESCNNLANALLVRFKHAGEECLFAEAIELHMEALSLTPSGHPLRFMSCNNVADSLWARFNQTGEESMLTAAIELYREALSLQTSDHPHRVEVCNRLVASLRTRFEITGDESLLVEAIDLSTHAMETQPLYHPNRWKPIINLSHIYLNPRFSARNTPLAIDYIQQALSLTSNDWPILLSEVAQLTGLIYLPMLSQHSLSQLLQCFSAAIDLASRVAGFVLDPQSQLRYLTSSQHLGPQAYWCALVCQQPQLGLELIERARAMMWTQALHMRNPQLTGAPPRLASELEVLLSRIHTLRVTEDLTSFLSPHDQDTRHKDSDRIHQLIQQIRAVPGQERFMRGLSYEALAQSASRNAVVMLVAAEGECHALILQSNNQKLVTLKLSDIAPNELITMSIAESAAQRRGSTPENVFDDYRAMKAAACLTRSEPVLAKLWTAVVKPIIDHLQLQVCTPRSSYSII